MRPSHLELLFEFSQQISLKNKLPDKIQQLKQLFKKSKIHCQTRQDWAECDTYIEFLNQGARIYRLCEDFSKDLFKTDLKIPSSIIPVATECILIEFPEWYVAKQEDTFIHSVYIYQSQFNENGKEHHRLRLQFPDYDENYKINGFLSYININLTINSFIDDMVDILIDGNNCINKEAVQFAIKTYLYIHSGEPDLRFLRHVNFPETKKDKKIKRFLKDNEGLFVDQTLLGYFHKKKMIYYVNNIAVSGHFRWQRYGPENSQLKYIWINPYVKNLDNSQPD